MRNSAFKNIKEIYQALIDGKKISILGDKHYYYQLADNGYLYECSFQQPGNRTMVSQNFVNPSHWHEFQPLYVQSREEIIIAGLTECLIEKDREIGRLKEALSMPKLAGQEEKVCIS